MRIRESPAICSFCSKPGSQHAIEWMCPKCAKPKKESAIYYNNETPFTDCCNARARMTKWECQFCGRSNDAKDAGDAPVKLEKKPFSGASYTGREDSLSRVMQGSEFLKKLRKNNKV